MQTRPGVGQRRALRLVQRRLRIPSHYDQFDLQSDDSVFDGDRYLAAVRRAGGVSRLTRMLLADSTPRSFRQLHSGRAAGAPSEGGIAEWWKELDITGAVTSGLKDFGASFVWDNVVKAGGKWVLGRFLDAYGLSAVRDFLFPQSDTARLIEMVERLTVRINALEEKSDKILKEIAELKAQVAATPAIRLLTHIDTNHNSLRNIAKLKPDEVGRAGATHALLRAIANDLDDRGLLNTVVAGKNGPGVLVLESRRAAVAPFFTPKDSQEIRSVYEYYALYQLRLANLLTEYWNTQSCSQPPGRTPDPQTCLAPSTIQDEFDPITDEHRDAEGTPQARRARGTLRGHPQEPHVGQCSTVGERRAVQATGGRLRQGQPPPVPEAEPGLADPGNDLAGQSEFRSLIDSVPQGQKPYEFLTKNAGLVSSAPAGTPLDRQGHMWLGAGGEGPTSADRQRGYKPVDRLTCSNRSCHYPISRVNLQENDRPGPHVFTNKLYDLDLHAYFGHAMPRPQRVAPNSYWHP